MMKGKTKEICTNALLIALVAVCTIVIHIPTGAANGYVHLGDSIILISSVFFGWKCGMIAGGLGSGLADILLGYGYWAPFTIIIKGIMGFVAGKIADYKPGTSSLFSVRNIMGSMMAEIIMIIGYFFGGAILKGGFIYVLPEVASNIGQGIGGMVIFFVIGLALDKAKVFKYISIK